MIPEVTVPAVPSIPPQKPFLSRGKFADLVGRKTRTVDRWIKSKKISHLRDGRRVMIDPVEAVTDLKRNLTVRAIGSTK